ncbi:PREDICTED: pentatricopeptide repeat-containing protein At5g57250, mitochondrial-like [Camelina sativa]|uniref:Pentatricopeptide repeat-containing protein At5g57250, mitochondrial-like n=1 Tax=Camelina sativa TaxID=90675 RepID=A0ABM0UMP8_CAMSA|nr:PREDICTED: pentatricopeptide repeat-containing protein At5g57250, mitochondrial-like [Camelina sativa]XP_010443405.1 PREDICTED: pentatricopeptide repeat-containing protein At5g57250, mitochondrial-like [Camelina sativa]
MKLHHRTSSGLFSLQSLLKSGFTPTLNSIDKFLRYLYRRQKFNCIVHFYSQLDSNQIEINHRVYSIVSWAFLNLNRYEDAEKFINTQISKASIFPRTHMLDSLIHGFSVTRDDPNKGLSILRDCLRSHGAFPSSLTFCSLIHRFVVKGEMDNALEVVEMMTNKKVNYPFDNFVCSAVVSGFVRIGKPELALGFYESAVGSGVLVPNLVTYTTVVSALCQLGKVDEVRDLVRRLEDEGFEFDCVFYSNWIHGCLEGGGLMNALMQYREMVKKGIISRDVVSYSILIDGLSKEGNMETSFGLLGKMIKEGIEPNLITFTAIIRGLCKKGKLEEAFALFDRIVDMGIEVDEFVYVTLIDGSCKKGNLNRAFSMLGDMELRGIQPSILTYNTVINGLCRAGRVSEADEISKGVVGDVVTYSTLLGNYKKEENMDAVLEIRRRFEEAKIPMDLVMCNILLKAFLLVGAYGEADAVYRAMPDMDLTPDTVTYSTMIEGFCKTGQIEEALEMFNELRKSSVSLAVCYNRIIDALCKKGMLETATEVLIELREKGLYLDIRTSRNLLHSIQASGGEKGILNLVYRLDQLNTDLFLGMFNDTILLLSKRGYFEAAIEVYMIMRRKGLTVTFPSTILKILVDNLRALDAYLLVVNAEESTLPSVDVVDYTIIVDGLCKEGFLVKALDLCSFAKSRGVILNIITYNSLIYRLCQQGCLVEALRLFDSLENIGLDPSEVTYSILIDKLCKEGLFLDAEKLLDTMVSKGLVPNILIYNSMIDGYCKLGHTEDAMRVLTRKMMGRVSPDAFTVSSVIKGYCKKGDMEEALRVFAEFKDENISADLLGFLFLIKGFCTKGRMEEARGLLREMLVSESVVKLINRVDAELVESESIRGFLVELCEQGRVPQAIKILEEISSNIYLSGKNLDFSQRPQFLNGVNEKEIKKEDYAHDFHSLHSTISSLCSNGKLKQANEFVMSVLSCMPK